MRNKIKNLKSLSEAKTFLNDHRADRVANRVRRDELGKLIGEYKEELRLLEKEYQANNDEDDILRRIGQLSVGE